MWRRGRRRRGRRRRGTPRADRARGRSTRRARTSPRTGPRRRWPIATRGVCPRGFPRAGVGGASRPRRRPAASTDCERGERRARRSTRPPREKTQTSVARTRQRRREDEPSRWTPSPTDGRRPRAARASLLTPDGTAGGWTMRGFRSRPARQRPHARCVKSIRRASLDRRRSRRSRRDFGGGGRCERPARLARRRRLSARVFASHFKPGAPPRPRERSTATIACAIPPPLPLPLTTRAVDASPPSPPRRGSSPPPVSVSTFFPSSFIVAPVITAAVGSRLRSCRAFAARLVRARSRVAPTPRARRVARTRA